MLKLILFVFFTMKQNIKYAILPVMMGYGTYYYFYFNYIKNNNQDIYKYI